MVWAVACAGSEHTIAAMRTTEMGSERMRTALLAIFAGVFDAMFDLSSARARRRGQRRGHRADDRAASVLSAEHLLGRDAPGLDVGPAHLAVGAGRDRRGLQSWCAR